MKDYSSHDICPSPTGVTGVILAGGKSVRMGSNKALLPFRGGLFIEAIYRQFSELFDEVLIVTNTPEQYASLPCRMVKDIFPDVGALAGLHAGLYHSTNTHIFAVACDMPYLNGSLVRKMSSLCDRADVVIPQGNKGQEPLHALYGKACLAPMERSLAAGQNRLVSFFSEVRVYNFPCEQIAEIDPDFDSFKNINTPGEYFGLRAAERSAELMEISTALNAQVCRAG